MAIELAPEELAETLKEVQDLDTRIFALERRIDELPEKHRLGEIAGELAGARDDLGSTEAEFEALSQKQHRLDGELDLLVKKMKAEEEKLFSGKITNPKELASIQAEIFSLRRKRDEMETEDLEEMEEMDRLSTALEELKRLVATAERGQEDALEKHGEELDELRAEVASLERERDALKARLPEEVVVDYDKLILSKAGLAVARIVQGRTCGGCRIEFSRSQVDRFQHEDGIFRCEYCRRILVK